jgi:UDP-N-acetylglucosamine 2-epimerase (non-hydrolysing)
MKKITIVVGTRPNFIKVTQFKKIASQIEDLTIEIVHTGQHFDGKMSKIFFDQFGLNPDHIINLEAATPVAQIGEIMAKLEAFFLESKPDVIVAVGDVNSTLAAALVANKMKLKLAHLESGLRSNDRTMPEEINRIITDQLADILLVTEESGRLNLLAEGKSPDQIFLVGNTMIDTMLAFEDDIDRSQILDDLSVKSKEFILMTMHRPATVDSFDGLNLLLNLLMNLPNDLKVVFPIHPRTIKNMESYQLIDQFRNLSNLILTEPLDYFSFQKLIKECKFILTDSGGIQEESTQRLVPCLTLRPNTERPVTVSTGTNTLVSFDVKEIMSYIKEVQGDTYKKGNIPEFWDGKATARVLERLIIYNSL